MTTIERTAQISEDQLYRYELTRRFDEEPLLTFVMLNPSTADADVDDPTIRRCISFARRDGWGGIRVVNLYALRSTDPKALLTAADPVGDRNDSVLRGAFMLAASGDRPIVAAWGANAKPARVAHVLSLVSGARFMCFGTTKSGQPKHPLYLPGAAELIPFA